MIIWSSSKSVGLAAEIAGAIDDLEVIIGKEFSPAGLSSVEEL